MIYDRLEFRVSRATQGGGGICFSGLAYLDKLGYEILYRLRTRGGHVCQNKSPCPPVGQGHLQGDLVMYCLAVLGVTERVSGEAPAGQSALIRREPARGRGEVGQREEGSYRDEACAGALDDEEPAPVVPVNDLVPVLKCIVLEQLETQRLETHRKRRMVPYQPLRPWAPSSFCSRPPAMRPPNMPESATAV